MATKITFVNNIPPYLKKNDQVVDDFIREVGRQVYNRSQVLVPVAKGTLQSSPSSNGDIVEKIATHRFRVGYYTAYARYIHRGISKTGKPLHFRKAGSKANYLADPAQTTMSQIPEIARTFFGREL